VSNLKSVAVTVLELLAFNSHDRPLRTDRQTHIERTHYLRHSLRSLGGDNNTFHFVKVIVQNTVNPVTVKTAFSMTSQLRQH